MNVTGEAGSSNPLFPNTKSGVWGESDSGYGVAGTSNTGNGVQGGSVSGIGVVGTSDSASGVVGMSASETGVYVKVTIALVMAFTAITPQRMA